MKLLTTLLLVAWLCCFSSYAFPNDNDPGAFDVSAFNIQIFGEKKMSDPVVKDHIVKEKGTSQDVDVKNQICLRYDLILIQEIRDSSGEAIYELLDALKTKDPRYKIVVSERLGRSVSKEQYAYIYRSDWVEVRLAYVYNDVSDVFQREPYIVHLHSERTGINDFVVGGIHTAPSDAEAEISHLADVYESIKQKLQINDVIFMGDFNAGCTYTKAWSEIKLARNHEFYWLIDNKEDTTTKASDCAYDRVVVAGQNVLKSIIPLSIGVFRFDVEYPELTVDQVLDISDHFPVHFQIASKANMGNVQSILACQVDDIRNNAVSPSKVYSLKNKIAEDSKYIIEATYTKTGAFEKIIFWRKVNGRSAAVATLLDDFLKDFDGFLSPDEVYTLIRNFKQTDPMNFLARGYGLYNTLYDYYKQKHWNYAIKFECGKVNGLFNCYIEIKNHEI